MYLKTQTNDSVLNMVLHLCDNDLDNSIFFINELLDSLFMHYEQEASEFEKWFRILGPILLIKDQYQQIRLEKCFWLADHEKVYTRYSEYPFIK